MELPSVCVIVKGKFTFTPTLNVCRIPLHTIPVPRELVFYFSIHSSGNAHPEIILQGESKTRKKIYIGPYHRRDSE